MLQQLSPRANHVSVVKKGMPRSSATVSPTVGLFGSGIEDAGKPLPRARIGVQNASITGWSYTWRGSDRPSAGSTCSLRRTGWEGPKTTRQGPLTIGGVAGLVASAILLASAATPLGRRERTTTAWMLPSPIQSPPSSRARHRSHPSRRRWIRPHRLLPHRAASRRNDNPALRSATLNRHAPTGRLVRCSSCDRLLERRRSDSPHDAGGRLPILHRCVLEADRVRSASARDRLLCRLWFPSCRMRESFATDGSEGSVRSMRPAPVREHRELHRRRRRVVPGGRRKPRDGRRRWSIGKRRRRGGDRRKCGGDGRRERRGMRRMRQSCDRLLSGSRDQARPEPGAMRRHDGSQMPRGAGDRAAVMRRPV
jgi:hypothetical protein